jgi:hypothetical protein
MTNIEVILYSLAFNRLQIQVENPIESLYHKTHLMIS